MTRHPRLRPRKIGPPLGLALVIAVFSSPPLYAQPLSSGSGAGTGTGMSGGAARNSTGTGLETGAGFGTGMEAGTGRPLPGSNNFIYPSGPGGRLLMPSGPPRGGGVSYGSGVDATFPGDTPGIPYNMMLESGLVESGVGTSIITERHLYYARRIPAAADRSLALSRIAGAAVFSAQLDVAEKALDDATTAGMLIPAGLVRDQRLTSIITALMTLAEARLREGRGDTAPPPAVDPAATTKDAPAKPAEALPLPPDRNKLISLAQEDWLRAANLARKLGSPTYRSEMMYKVADGMAYASQTIVNEFPGADSGTDGGSKAINSSFGGLPDQLLKDAAALASAIERPVWHDRALVAVATAAAESKQFFRALSIVRLVPQPEVRSDGLLKIAEIQARRGDPKGATATYLETAEAVASVPLVDVRGVLAGVLIDNLIAVGRFEDARASIGLYADAPHRLTALGTIAEAQGRRGAAKSALAWINTEVPAQYRSQLYRRVSNGVVGAVEQNRSRDLSNRGDR